MKENAAAMSPDFTLTEEDMTALTNMDQVSNSVQWKMAVLTCSADIISVEPKPDFNLIVTLIPNLISGYQVQG